MKYMDIDCYERGCACASSSRVAGEDYEVIEVVKLTDEVVADYLQKKIDHLWQMTESNMKLNLMNIMDDLRLETIDVIKPVIAILKKASENE